MFNFHFLLHKSKKNIAYPSVEAHVLLSWGHCLLVLVDEQILLQANSPCPLGIHVSLKSFLPCKKFTCPKQMDRTSWSLVHFQNIAFATCTWSQLLTLAFTLTAFSHIMISAGCLRHCLKYSKGHTTLFTLILIIPFSLLTCCCVTSSHF